VCRNAYESNQEGRYPALESVSETPTSDCLWLGAPESEDGVRSLEIILQELMPVPGIDSVRDVQLLRPMTSIYLSALRTTLERETSIPACPQATESRQFIATSAVLKLSFIAIL